MTTKRNQKITIDGKEYLKRDVCRYVKDFSGEIDDLILTPCGTGQSAIKNYDDEVVATVDTDCIRTLLGDTIPIEGLESIDDRRQRKEFTKTTQVATGNWHSCIADEKGNLPDCDVCQSYIPESTWISLHNMLAESLEDSMIVTLRDEYVKGLDDSLRFIIESEADRRGL